MPTWKNPDGTPVTDPAVLAQLNGAPSADSLNSAKPWKGPDGKPVTDPETLAQLNGASATTAAPVQGFTPGQAPTPDQLAGLQANWGKTASGAAPPEVAAPVDPGPAANAAAALNDMVYRGLGAPIDITNTALRVAAAGVHAAGGPDIQLPVDTPGGHQSIADLFAKFGTTDPSKVAAVSNADKLARGAATGIGYAVAPEMLLGTAAKAMPALEGVASVVRPFIGMGDTPGAVAGNVLAGAAGGAGAQAAEDVAPDNLKPLAAVVGGVGGAGAGSLAAEIPSIAAAGGRLAKEFVAPLSIGGQERLAGERLAAASDSSVGTLKDTLANRGPDLPGVQPTTAQAVSAQLARAHAAAGGEGPAPTDYGLFNLERTLSTKNATPFVQRAAENNAARVSSMQSVQEPGAPEIIASAIKGNLDSLARDEEVAATAHSAQAGQAAVKQTAVAADAATNMAPAAHTEDIGAGMRQALETARAGTKVNERALWDAVDPTNSMTVSLHNTLATQQRLTDSITPLTAPITGTEARIHAALSALDDPMQPLNSVADLSKQLTAAMREERSTAGESPTWARLSQMKGAVEKDLSDAVVGKVAGEQRAVQTGALGENDTILARLKAWQDDYYGRQKSGVLGTQGFSGDASAGSAAVPGLRGTAGQAGIGPTDATGRPGVPQDIAAPPAQSEVDTGAVARLKTAQQATIQRVNTFDNSTLAPIRARPSKVTDYNMPSGAVPGKIFFPGPKSPEAIQRYRAAVGDETAVPLLHQYAATKLRTAAQRTDGTLDPGRTASFVRNHADALRALPGFNTKVLDAVKASQGADAAVKAASAKTGGSALAEASQGIVGKLSTLTDPTDVSRTIGTVFNRADSMAQMQRVKDAIGPNPAAQEGLKKAVANHLTERFIGSTEAGLTGVNAIKSAQLQNFLTKHAGALKVAGFEPTQMTTLRRIADSLQDASRSVNAVKLPGGPNTARDLLATKALDAPNTMLTKILVSAAMAGGDVGLGTAIAHVAGPVTGTVAGVGAALAGGILSALRQQGLTRIDQLIERAMLDPKIAEMLLKKVKLSNTRRATVSLGQRFTRSTIGGAAAATPYR